MLERHLRAARMARSSTHSTSDVASFATDTTPYLLRSANRHIRRSPLNQQVPRSTADSRQWRESIRASFRALQRQLVNELCELGEVAALDHRHVT